MEDLTQYLEPSFGIDSGAPEIISLSSKLTAGCSKDSEAAARLFSFTRDSFRYNPFAPFSKIEDFLGTALLKRGHGFCTQKSALLISLCRAAGIPARFRFADLVNHNLPGRLGQVLGTNKMIYHTYAEMFIGGRWLKATPSFEKGLCEKMGWRLCHFDGSGDAILSPTDLEGRPHIEYVLDRGTAPSLPLDDMLATWLKEYGANAFVRWEEAAGDNTGSWPSPECAQRR